jgi:hypothetical protein
VALRDEAAAFQEFGRAQGVASVLAEAAVLWLEVGEPDLAATTVAQVAGPGLDVLPRDVDLLLVLASVVEVTSALRTDDELLDAASRLLEPAAGRAVLNAGAVSFHGVVDDHLARAALALGHDSADRWRHDAAAAYRRIGARWWATRLEGATRPDAAPPTAERAPAPTTVHLRPVDARWEVGPPGATSSLPDLKGLRYLRVLVARPGIDVGARELSDAVAGHAGRGVGPSDAGPVLDDAALAAYRCRLAELDSELDEADAWSDLDRAERLAAERDALLAEIGAAVGLGGRRRRAGDVDERARVAVRKAIAAALGRWSDVDPETARLVSDAVRTGSTCRYDPDPARPVRWVLDGPA